MKNSIIPKWLDDGTTSTHTGPLKCARYRICRRVATVKHYPKCKANEVTLSVVFNFCDECSATYPFPAVRTEPIKESHGDR